MTKLILKSILRFHGWCLEEIIWQQEAVSLLKRINWGKGRGIMKLM